MKTLKNIFGILLMGLSMATICSCDDEVEYTPAEKPTNDQVYFPSTLSASYDLNSEANSFTIQVQRVKTDAAATISLSVSDESGKLTIPTSVDFAAGAEMATLTIGYNAEDFEYDVYHNVTIALPETYTTPYGNGSYKFAVGIPAPWTDWELFATGTYTYTQYWAGDDPERNVYKRSSKIDPTQSQFKVEGVFYGIDFIIDYNEATHVCRIAPQYTAYEHSKYGSLYTSDVAYYNAESEAENASTFNPETGLFSFYLIFYVADGYFAYGYEYLQLDGYEQPDYSLNLSNAGHYVDPTGTDNAVIHIFKGADVASYKCILKEGALSGGAIDAAIEGLADGTIEADTLYTTGYKAFPLDEEGKYTAIAVGFDENDEVVNTASLTFDFIPVGMSDPWKSLGMCAYTEDCMTTFFKVENLTYGVEIREHEKKPGLYRLVNAYGAAYPYNEEGDYDTTKEYYIEIDAQDPTTVYITNSSTGMDWGYGEFSVWSLADYYMENNGLTLEEVKAEGICGTLENGVITFPAKSLLISMADYNNGAYSFSNVNGAFKVDMTNLQSAATTMSARAIASPSRVVKEQNSTRFKAVSNDYMKGVNVDGKVFINQRNQIVK